MWESQCHVSDVIGFKSCLIFARDCSFAILTGAYHFVKE